MIEVSVAASRLILSGIMERHPKLKIVMSHTGGALPYQSGRMDKNSKAALLPQPLSTYIKRMYTDTVSPHPPGMKFAIDYYGIDHVMYGTDYPCWDPAPCLKLLEDVRLSPADKQKLFYDNARRIPRPQGPGAGEGDEERASAGLAGGQPVSNDLPRHSGSVATKAARSLAPNPGRGSGEAVCDFCSGLYRPRPDRFAVRLLSASGERYGARCIDATITAA